MDAARVFHKIPRIDESRLAEVFAREVLAMLVRKELLSPEWAEPILSWRPRRAGNNFDYSRLRGTEVYRLLTWAAGFLVTTRSSCIDFRGD